MIIQPVEHLLNKILQTAKYDGLPEKYMSTLKWQTDPNRIKCYEDLNEYHENWWDVLTSESARSYDPQSVAHMLWVEDCYDIPMKQKIWETYTQRQRQSAHKGVTTAKGGVKKYLRVVDEYVHLYNTLDKDSELMDVIDI